MWRSTAREGRTQDVSGSFSCSLHLGFLNGLPTKDYFNTQLSRARGNAPESRQGAVVMNWEIFATGIFWGTARCAQGAKAAKK